MTPWQKSLAGWAVFTAVTSVSAAVVVMVVGLLWHFVAWAW